MAKSKGKGKAKEATEKPAALKRGQRVKVIGGDYGNSQGVIERIAGKNCTVFVHGRLTITVPADTLRAA